MVVRRPLQKTCLHFDLRHSGANEDYQLHVRGQRLPLLAHTKKSRNLACTENVALDAMSAEQRQNVTHYINDIELPADTTAHYYVTRIEPDLAINELSLLSLSFIHIPQPALEACRKEKLKAEGSVQNDPRCEALGIEFDGNEARYLEIQSGLDRFHHPQSAAYSIISQHPQLAAQDHQTAARILVHSIIPAPGIGNLVSKISSQGQEGWAISTPAVNHAGEEYTWSDQFGERSGKTVFHYKLTDITATAAQEPLSHACNVSQNDLQLKNKKWSTLQGQPNEVVHPTPLSTPVTPDFANPSSNFVLKNKTPGHGLVFQLNTLKYTPGANNEEAAKFSINIVNYYLRIMWAWVQYLDDKGNVLDAKGNPASDDHYEQIGSGVVSSVNTLLAIPIPSAQNLEFPWPENAASVRIINAGLGTNITQPDLAWRGILLTALFQYAIPTFFVIAGVMLERGDYYKRWSNNKIVLETLFSAIESLVGSLASQGPSLDNGIGVLAGFENGLSGFVVSSAAGAIGAYVAEKTAEAEIIDSVPIIGWVARVASIAITAADVLETTIEVATSPSSYEVEIKRILPVNVSMLPDPTIGTSSVPPTWPADALGGTFHFQVQYKDGSNYSIVDKMPTTTNKDAIIGRFPALPAGGKFQVMFGVYTKDNWLAGHWTSGWFDALPPKGGGALDIHGAIIQSLAKLTSQTRYDYQQSLRFENNQHVWKSGVKPTAVESDLKCDTSPLALCQPSEITINDKAYMIGYVWQSAGMNIPDCATGSSGNETLYAFQNINIGATPEASLKYPSCGFTAKPAIIYDQFGPAPLVSLPLTEGTALDSKTISDKVKADFASVGKPLPDDTTVTVVTETAEWTLSWANLPNPAYVLRRSPTAIEVHAYPSAEFSQRNFYVDPRNGQHHLRKVTLDNSTNFEMHSDVSWGRFNFAHLDAFAIHPAGYAIGVSASSNRLDVIKLPKEGSPDKDAQRALTLAGIGSRQGLVNQPTALTVTSDGRILVMEKGNLRVQAFDINGNPCPSFDGPEITTVSDPDAAASLDNKRVTLALRQKIEAAGVHLSERWLLQDGPDQIQIDLDDTKLALRRDGADLSTQWTIADASTSYYAKLVGSCVIVSVPGTDGIKLPDGSQSSLDRQTITPEITNAFKENNITLSAPISVSGNGLFVQRDGNEEQLALGEIPEAVTTALATRNITLPSKTKVHDALDVIILNHGNSWVIRDAPHSNSYKVTEGNGVLSIIEYLPFFSLHNAEGRYFTAISSELKGYLYVLSNNGKKSGISDYVLDIYNPNGTWLTSTSGINAAKLVVTQWRTVYTLDYQAFAGPGGRTEPSVSMWIPETPKSSQ